MVNSNYSFSELKQNYGRTNRLSNLFRWVSFGLGIIEAFYLVVFLASMKNIGAIAVVVNIVLLSLFLLCLIASVVLWQYFGKQSELYKQAGLHLDKAFSACVDEVELKKTDLNARISKILVTTVIYIFLVFIAVIIIFPFYWMIISSLKSWDEFRLTIPTLWPKKFLFDNYKIAFEAAELGTLFINTLYVGLVSTILSLIITVLSAFAFARLEFKGKNTLFAALLATMMIPGELFTITNYATVSKLGWLNTFSVLIFPFLVSVFYIYLLRQNFMQIPNELYLAAKVDGTSDMKYLLKIMVPLSMPTLISITILKMMGSWNSYVWPNLVAKADQYELITNGLRNTAFPFRNEDGTLGTPNGEEQNLPAQMAAVAIVSAPLFMVFLLFRKYIMRGVSRSGIKG